ncbi:MAG TPA: MMPL family transporter [Candidatus Sulfotelmatobacter sp.]|nr:MMPL family transporter [Candidatus Sulfotelmatobacter sp.]
MTGPSAPHHRHDAPHGRPWTVRVAAWSAAHRWPVLVGWFVLTIGVFGVNLAAGGIRTVGATGGPGGSTTESERAYQVFDQAGTPDPHETMTIVVTSPSLQATAAPFRSAVEDILGRLKAATAEVQGTTGPAFRQLVDPYAAPPQAGLIAPDLTGVRIEGEIGGDDAVVETRTEAIAPVITAIKAAYPSYAIHAVANTLTNDQINTLVNEDLDGALKISLPATFLILLIAFGAIVAAIVPLILAVTALLAAFGLLGLYSQAVGAVSPYATQLVVLIGLAVAVDYSLFMVTRFRAERRAGREVEAAIETASATAGRAVFFSGLAVMISVAGLFILPDTLFRSMALGTISVIAVAVLGSLTFLPALLAILGDRVDRGRVPVLGRPRPAGGGAWARLVEAVVHRPIISALGAAAVLLILAGPVTHLRLGNSDVTSFPESIDGVQAIEVLQAHWPAGTILSLDVVVTDATAPATKSAIAMLQQRGLQVAGLSGPATVTPSGDGTVAMVSFVMSGTENDPANWQAVRDMRTTVVPQALAQAPGAAAYVTGNAAVSLDQTQVFTDGMVKIFVFVLGLSFLLLLAVFRSLVIPLKAIVLNLLSTGAAYGVLVLVFQDGFLGGPLGVRPSEVIQNWVPVFVFTILFGLSMDYEVFILTRVKEWHDGGLDTHRAVARGIAMTAGTVTSAAAIMVVVFAVFVTLRLVIIRELGLGLAVAVFLDATVIRAILLPASMRLLGEWNWYLPRFLRWLPRITIETPARPETSSSGPHATA